MKYFNNIRANGDSARREPAAKQANDYLDRAARSRDSGIESERERLQLARKHGGLAKDTTDDEIEDYASKVGYHLQAVALLTGNPSREALTYMEEQVNAGEHPEGASFTEKHGDMRVFGGRKTAAKQRAMNTRGMHNEEALHGVGGNGGGGEEKDELYEIDRQQLAKAGGFDDGEVAQATQDSWNQQQPPTPFNQHQQQNLNENMMSTMMGATPAQPTATPKETPAIDVEVREDALMAIMGEDDATERGVALQRVYSGLTEKPRDAQIMKGNAVLNKKGKSTEERLEGLVKLEKIRMKSENK